MNEVANESVDDKFLSKQNLGVGNYSGKEMYQQIQSFKNGLYSENAFGKLLYRRAIKETQTKLAKEGWRYVDPHKNAVVEIKGWVELTPDERSEIWADELQRTDEQMTKRRWIERRGEEEFETLIERRNRDVGRAPAREAMKELAGWDGEWQSPHLRMIMARHETSRSRGARLLDNVFGRIKKTIAERDDVGDGGLR